MLALYRRKRWGNMEIILIVILAVAISIDGFNVGITYGLQGITLGWLSILIISLTSMFAIFLTGNMGILITNYISINTAEIIGSIILIMMGCWLLYITYRDNGRMKNKLKEFNINFKIKSFNIMIKILKEPKEADIDHSGSIGNKEAVFLGITLALDAMGAGLGAGLNGISIKYLAFFIGIINYSFITGGYFLGKKLENKFPPHFEFYPGLIIILLGLIKLTWS